MKDVEVDSDHATKKTIIYEADVDIGIIPLVRWLNSLKGIMTRWSCQGENPKKGVYSPPYVTIWVEEYGEPDDNDFELVEHFLGQYNVEIENRNTKEWIGVYNITFSSSTELQKIQSVLAAEENNERLAKIAHKAGEAARNKTLETRRAEEAARAEDRRAYIREVVEPERDAQNRTAHERFTG